MSQKFATKFNYYHHSPASTQKPTEIDIFQKLLKARGEPIQYPSVVTVGIAGEEYVKAELIEGLPSDAAYRHALARLDQHELLPWDKQADEDRNQVHRDGAHEANCQHASEGINTALKGANQITGQQKLEKKFAGLALPFLGFADFFGGNRVAELKCKTSLSADTKLGRRAGALPSKPDPKHVAQVGYYANVLECPASLVYANEKDYRIFDEINCQELTAEGMSKALDDLRARAWSRENLMRAAPDYRRRFCIIGYCRTMVAGN